jgi:hypothetical protein
MRRRTLLAGAAASAPALVRAQESTASLSDLARRATIYLFPVYEMYRTRWRATVDETNPLRQRLNRFRHVTQLADHRSPAVTPPNNDTFYSSAWLDLSVDPLFLTVPPVGDLYYSYAFLDLFTNNFAHVSHRLHGGEPPAHMIVGPAWNGDPPSEVKVIRAPTSSVWLLGRLLVDGPDEIDQVRILQGRVLLETPDMRNERRILETGELMRHRATAPVEPVADWRAPNPADPFDLLEVAMQALGESGLGERDRMVVEGFAPLKLKPGRKFDRRGFDKAEQHEIESGIRQAHAEIRAAAGRFVSTVDGWTYGRHRAGNLDNDSLYRAHIALTGLAALEPAEAIHVIGSADADGQPLTGANRYRLTFLAGAMPPARAFWSLSVYEVEADGRAFFIDAPIGRHSIGDHTHDLQRNIDGSLTIHLQHDRPDDRNLTNWLPIPAGPMRCVLRAYEPDEALVTGRYQLPAIRRNPPA